MFNSQSTYSDTADREKLKILQSLSQQIETMTFKLDQIVSHVEEVHFKIPQANKHFNSSNNIGNLVILPSSGLNFENDKIIKLNNENLNNTHILITINDSLNELQPIVSNKEIQLNNKKITGKKVRKIKSNNSDLVTTNRTQSFVEPTTREFKAPDTTAKRNKQQRQFNTFVRESINQLLGPDFMRTHDVQDIDCQVMEMIRKEAVENYLPENIRPRRAWHLAKASLRTLKRTLNNRK